MRAGSVRLFVWLGVGLFVVQLAFTTVVRGYIVPKMTPEAHWRFGLQRSSDSQAFHLTAARLASRMRAAGWGALDEDAFVGLGHAQVIAAIYYLTGRDDPRLVYVVDALLFGVSGVLLAALLLRLRITASLSAVGAAVIMCSPLTLFSHSELLREPFLLPAVAALTLGLLMMLGASANTARPERLSGAVLVLYGYAIASAVRPYFLILLAGLMGGIVVGASVFWALSRGKHFGERQVLWTVLTFVLCLAYAAPRLQQAGFYMEQTAGDRHRPPGIWIVNEENEPEYIDADTWRRKFANRPRSARLTRAELQIPHWCTVDWRTTRGIPALFDKGMESIACSRQDYLRFCDVSLLGAQADRGCDSRNFQTAAKGLALIPHATAFALLVPLPSMWLESFGAGGTGLRRAGYVIDGLLDYVLLAGLVLFVWRLGKRQPEVWLVALALLALVSFHGMAVPTQFVLSRIRLPVYTPLLAIGAAGWLTWIHDRRAGGWLR
jgi:hypothetical protein